jgi:hypothetical protein
MLGVAWVTFQCRQLVTQAILFQVDRRFCLVFIIGFVIECVVAFSMESVKEQRICVKLFQSRENRSRNPQVARRLRWWCLESNDDLRMIQTFWKWKTSTDDNEQSDRPSTIRSEPLIAQVKNIISGNHRLKVSCMTALNYSIVKLFTFLPHFWCHWFIKHQINTNEEPIHSIYILKTEILAFSEYVVP